MTVAERKFVALVAVVGLLTLLIVFDPFQTARPSHRMGGLLFIGPLSVGYGVNGLVQGSFPEMENATRDGTRWKFWFCAVFFIALGLGSTFAGVDAFFRLGILIVT
jgi:hypothetical protein